MKLLKIFIVAVMATVASGCAVTGSVSGSGLGGLFSRSSLPSCSNVSGYGNYSIPLGAERVGSRLWVERRIIFHQKVGGTVRAVAAYRADGEWQAPEGLWQVTLSQGLLSQYNYDVNFDVKAEETGLSSNRLERRDVEVYLRIFGPEMGAYGQQYTIRMVAIKYRGAPDTDWAICPKRY